MLATASIRRMSSASHSLDTGWARTKSEGVAKPRIPAASRMHWAVRWYLWLEGSWAVPWLTRLAMPSFNKPVRTRWTVAWASPRMPASSAESTNGVRLRESSICRSERAMCRA